MKFDYGSDLHLDFDKGSNRVLDCFPLERSPVLILAGDIAEIAILKGKSCALKTQVQGFFAWVSQNYSTVLYIMGNHEYFDAELNYGVQNLRAIFSKLGLNNIQVLENDRVEFEDTVVFGTTMWTSMRGGNPNVMNAIQAGMQDCRYIKYVDEYYERVTITPEHTLQKHRTAISSLKNFIKDPTGKYKVIVTHHAPHIQSIDRVYRGDALTDAYYEELFDLVFGSDIHTWVHGHTHSNSDYLINKTRVLANPRGYWGSEDLANNFKIKQFDTSIRNWDLEL
jgi:UDP-2,3-diacylglucosamine pyrophosphatase LpxH